MKTVKSITPEQAELSLVIISGPRGSVQDDNWPCIEYKVRVTRRRQVVYTGEYRLGVGHVKWPKEAECDYVSNPKMRGLTSDEQNVCRIHARGQLVKKTPEGMATEASAAAKLAGIQKVTPRLHDVVSSLVRDGSAFFDGERFEDWAANLGYNPDSRKAEATFRACDEIGRALSRALSRDELDGLREWASNY